MREELKDFSDFIKKKQVTILMVFFSVLLCYGKHAFTQNVDIDTEDLLAGGMSNLNGWLTIGRFGSYYTKKILGVFQYNPYFCGVLFLLLFTLAASLWMYNFYLFSNKNQKYPYWLFGMIYVTSQVWCFIFYFSMIQLEVVVGVCCVAIANYLIFYAIYLESKRLNRIFRYLIATVLIVWGIGCYQAILVEYLIGCTILLLVCYRKQMEDRTLQAGIFLKKVMIIAIHFVFSYIMYAIIAKCYFSGSDYLVGQIVWRDSIVMAMVNIVKFVYYCFFVQNGIKTYILLAEVVFLGVDIIFVCLKKIKLVEKCLYIGLIICSTLSIFALCIYIGNGLADRTQFPVCLYIGFMAMYVTTFIPEYKWERNLRLILVTIMCIFMYQQTAINLRLWYTDDLCNQQNLVVAQTIYRDICALGRGEVPDEHVVFVGNKQVNLNAATIQADMFGVSNFCWDNYNVASSSTRIALYMRNVIGVGYLIGDDNEKYIAIEKGKNMPQYPNPGYVQLDVEHQLIIVKLSEY